MPWEVQEAHLAVVLVTIRLQHGIVFVILQKIIYLMGTILKVWQLKQLLLVLVITLTVCRHMIRIKVLRIMWHQLMLPVRASIKRMPHCGGLKAVVGGILVVAQKMW